MTIALLTSSCMTMGLGHLNTNQPQNQRLSNETSNVDPVCGNSITRVSEDLSYKYDGSVYHFHTRDCLNEFKQAPEKYIAHNDMNYHHNNYGIMWGLGAVTVAGMVWLMYF